MNYLEACKYIFEKRGQDWSLHPSKYRGTKLVLTRQICMTVGRWVYPEMTLYELSLPFGKKYSTVIHSEKHLDDLCFTDKKLKLEMREYEKYIRNKKTLADLDRIRKIKEDDRFIRRIENLVSDMKMVALAYCLITNQKIISNESENKGSPPEVQGNDRRSNDNDKAGSPDNAG